MQTNGWWLIYKQPKMKQSPEQLQTEMCKWALLSPFVVDHGHNNKQKNGANQPILIHKNMQIRPTNQKINFAWLSLIINNIERCEPATPTKPEKWNATIRSHDNTHVCICIR